MDIAGVQILYGAKTIRKERWKLDEWFQSSSSLEDRTFAYLVLAGFVIQRFHREGGDYKSPWSIYAILLSKTMLDFVTRQSLDNKRLLHPEKHRGSQNH